MQKGDVFKVLDHGYVILNDWMGNDEDIVRAARNSTGKGFEGWEPTTRCKSCRSLDGELHEPSCGYKKIELSADSTEMRAQIASMYELTNGDLWLLEYLLANKHTTPFEMVELKLDIQAPIMVFREWHRHRTQSYSEFSARYAQMPNLHYIPELERICKQSKSNKQGSGESFPEEYAAQVIADLNNEQQRVYENYDRMVNDGVAKEVARIDTPVSRYSKMTVKTDLWNWLAFQNLRHDLSAQWEIRQYANVLDSIIKYLFPRTHGLWEEHMRYAVRFSRTEHQVLIKALQNPEIAEVFRIYAKGNLPEKKAAAFLKKLTTARV